MRAWKAGRSDEQRKANNARERELYKLRPKRELTDEERASINAKAREYYEANKHAIGARRKAKRASWTEEEKKQAQLRAHKWWVGLSDEERAWIHTKNVLTQSKVRLRKLIVHAVEAACEVAALKAKKDSEAYYHRMLAEEASEMQNQFVRVTVLQHESFKTRIAKRIMMKASEETKARGDKFAEIREEVLARWAPKVYDAFCAAVKDRSIPFDTKNLVKRAKFVDTTREAVAREVRNRVAGKVDGLSAKETAAAILDKPRLELNWLTIREAAMLRTLCLYVGYTGRESEDDRIKEAFAWLCERSRNPVLRWATGKCITEEEARNMLGFKVMWVFEKEMECGLFARLVESFMHAELHKLPYGVRCWSAVWAGSLYIGKEANHGVFFTYSPDVLEEVAKEISTLLVVR